MQYRVKGAYSNYIIDTVEGMVYQLNTVLVKKVEVERRTRFKRFKKIEEAYEYLSQTENMPIWKLKSQSKILEVHK
jgi:C4-type Zn-finger protein